MLMPFIQNTGVHISYKGKIYGNNTDFFINDVGRTTSGNALQCVSGKEHCCFTPPYRYGQWHFPNRTRVYIEYYNTTIYRSRTDNGTVNLNRRNSSNASIMSLTGQYCCHVPDAKSIIQTLCANIGKCVS